MNLTERVERLEKLVGVGIPEDIQDIGRLIESVKRDTASLELLLYDAERAGWLAGLDRYDFQMLWSNALPAIFREAKGRGYLQMKDLDILNWTVHRPTQIEIRFAGEVRKGERE